MSVLTHARTAPDLHLSDLDPITRYAVKDAFEDARLAANCAEYALAQKLIAGRLGVVLPPSGELALCTCGCGCDAITDAAHVRTWQPGDGTETVQCPDCDDDHRITD